MNGPFNPVQVGDKWGVHNLHRTDMVSPAVFTDKDTAQAACNLVNAGYAAGFAAGALASSQAFEQMLQAMLGKGTIEA